MRYHRTHQRFSRTGQRYPPMITIDPPRSSPLIAVSDKAVLTRFLNRAREAVGLQGDISVLLTTDDALRRLNRTYRGKNKATDVLSFPSAPPAFVGGPTQVAGDLAISLETAARQAAEHGHTLRDEVRILLLHGVLHLAGYDHESDAGEMAEREAELRSKLRLPTSLIARSEVPVLPRTPARADRRATPRKAAAR